jgi:nucleoside-diphosphate-sugar epimerase
MTTLITGGNGFIGLALTEHLVARGETAIRHDRATDELATRWLRDGSEIVSGDIRDIDALRRTLIERGVDTVIHAAAMTPDREIERTAAAQVVDVNVLATARLIECCAELPGIRRVVVLSSVAVYGFSEPAASGYYDEAASAPAPTTLYGITKLAAEQAALRIGELHGLDVRVARIGPVFGPWEHATGVRPSPSPHHQTMLAAMAGRPVVLERAMVADWLYSRDAARQIAFIAQAQQLEHPLYNVGAGQMSDLADWCGWLAEHVPAFSWRFAQRGEPPTIHYGLPFDRPALSTSRLTHELGNGHTATPLSHAARDYLQWTRDVGYRG